MNTATNTEKTTVTYPDVVTRREWLAARKALLETEKEHTRAKDRLNQQRRELPMVEIDAPYTFHGPQGPVSLLDLFEGNPQLIIYHFMWLWENGQPLDRPCKSCSAWADSIARGHLAQLGRCGTAFSLVSRAPYEKIHSFKEQMNWKMPWYSSADSSFNRDFNVTIDPASEDPVYNYRSRSEHVQAGTDYYFYGDEPFDLPGLSCFLRVDDKVYHTYSTYGRGCEWAGGAYDFLDLTALGRQEDWELPKGRDLGMGAKAGSDTIKYPDELDGEANTDCCHAS